MMKSIFITIAITVLFVSCKSRHLINDFELGSPESVWKSEISKKLSLSEFSPTLFDNSDTSRFFYNWKLGKDSMFVTVSFNNDGVKNGDLRLVIINLTAGEFVKKESFSTDSSFKIFENSPSVFSEYFGDGNLNNVTHYNICTQGRFLYCLSYLQSIYGNEDSVTYDIAQKDTLYYKYNFHTNNSRIILRRTKLKEPNRIITFPYYFNAEVIEYLNDYENELQKTIDSLKPKLKPSDVVNLPISYEIIKQPEESLFNLKLRTKLIVSSWCRTNYLESRDIEKVRGEVVFLDKYKDTLARIDNCVLNTHGQLKGQIPSLNYALQQSERNVSYEVYNFSRAMLADLVDKTLYYETPDYFVYQNHELLNAIKNGESIQIEFIPNVLIFEDGSFIK